NHRAPSFNSRLDVPVQVAVPWLSNTRPDRTSFARAFRAAVAVPRRTVVPAPACVPPCQVRAVLICTVPAPASVPPVWVRLASVDRACPDSVPPERVSVPAPPSWWTVSVPDEWVTDAPGGITTSSAEPGTAPPVQKIAVDQLPPGGPTQVTVFAPI